MKYIGYDDSSKGKKKIIVSGLFRKLVIVLFYRLQLDCLDQKEIICFLQNQMNESLGRNPMCLDGEALGCRRYL